jgi:hypothetical protein
MVVAAFVVSILAIVISAGSVWYTRAQALAADKSAKIAAEAWYVKRTPRLEAQRLRSRRWESELELVNRGPTDLVKVIARLPPGPDTVPLEGFLSLADPDAILKEIELGAIAFGERRQVWVVAVTAGTAQIVCECHAAGGETWTVRCDVEIPPDATQSVW